MTANPWWAVTIFVLVVIIVVAALAVTGMGQVP